MVTLQQPEDKSALWRVDPRHKAQNEEKTQDAKLLQFWKPLEPRSAERGRLTRAGEVKLFQGEPVIKPKQAGSDWD